MVLWSYTLPLWKWRCLQSLLARQSVQWDPANTKWVALKEIQQITCLSICELCDLKNGRWRAREHPWQDMWWVARRNIRSRVIWNKTSETVCHILADVTTGILTLASETLLALFRWAIFPSLSFIPRGPYLLSWHSRVNLLLWLFLLGYFHASVYLSCLLF